MQLDQMSKDERSLLLYFEAQAADYGGKLDARRMNKEDFDLFDKWKASGFVQGGRIAFSDVKTHGQHTFDHWVVLSEEAWKLAHAERRARCERVMAKMTVERLGLPEPEEAAPEPQKPKAFFRRSEHDDHDRMIIGLYTNDCWEVKLADIVLMGGKVAFRPVSHHILTPETTGLIRRIMDWADPMLHTDDGAERFTALWSSMPLEHSVAIQVTV